MPDHIRRDVEDGGEASGWCAAPPALGLGGGGKIEERSLVGTQKRRASVGMTT